MTNNNIFLGLKVVKPMSARQRRVELSRITSKMGCKSCGEFAMARSTSEMAVCCSTSSVTRSCSSERDRTRSHDSSSRQVFLVHAQPFVGFRYLCRENLPPYIE
jgi:hypothetical protein